MTVNSSENYSRLPEIIPWDQGKTPSGPSVCPEELGSHQLIGVKKNASGWLCFQKVGSLITKQTNYDEKR